MYDLTPSRVVFYVTDVCFHVQYHQHMNSGKSMVVNEKGLKKWKIEITMRYQKWDNDKKKKRDTQKNTHNISGFLCYFLLRFFLLPCTYDITVFFNFFLLHCLFSVWQWKHSDCGGMMVEYTGSYTRLMRIVGKEWQ